MEPLFRLFIVLLFAGLMAAGLAAWITFLVLMVVMAAERLTEELQKIYGSGNVRNKKT